MAKYRRLEFDKLGPEIQAMLINGVTTSEAQRINISKNELKSMRGVVCMGYRKNIPNEKKFDRITNECFWRYNIDLWLKEKRRIEEENNEVSTSSAGN